MIYFSGRNERLRYGAINFQRIEIGDVLWAADGTLVSDQGVLAEDENRNPVELSRDFACERFVGAHSGDAG
jgi:hypothetical protein